MPPIEYMLIGPCPSMPKNDLSIRLNIPLAGFARSIQAMLLITPGIPIGASINTNIVRRKGMSVRSRNQANRIAIAIDTIIVPMAYHAVFKRSR